VRGQALHREWTALRGATPFVLTGMGLNNGVLPFSLARRRSFLECFSQFLVKFFSNPSSLNLIPEKLF